jgi:tRNA(Ile)-lysidine synthase
MMRKKEFAARIWAKLVAGEKRLGFPKAGDRILAAVSGGPDSVCLAHYLTQAARRKGCAVTLIHIHHGLRGKEADKDAAFVKDLGAKLGLPVVLRRVRVAAHAAKRGKGLEDAGRDLRYKVFLREARRLGCRQVATGHHMDDQAETVLLNLLRGTRAEGLAGIPPRRPLAARIEVLRPLLVLTRADILAYLKVQGLSHRTDRSNRSLTFTRNWMRRKVLPLLETKNPRIREHLAGISDQIRAGVSPSNS